MKTKRQVLGNWGEQEAAEYLKNKGYTILANNVRTAYGELDLVAQQEMTIVFVEVKTRASHLFGFPEQAVTMKKKAHLMAAAEAYMTEHLELGEDWRIDVIAIRKLSTGQEPEIIHYENTVAED
jgi:putative endonuclease